jgi:hypothetical protein
MPERVGATAFQLADLLLEPKESLDVEIKTWLDLGDKEHCAALAKAAIAMANHGGGTVIIGFTENRATGRFDPALGRPNDLRSYGQDAISAIVAKHVEPNFHCDAHLALRALDGLYYPVIRVPGATVPIRSKIDSPNGTIKNNCYYTRRPGPQSEQPRTGQEWDALIRRCVTASRGSLVDSIRTILLGSTPTAPVGVEASLDRWVVASREQWEKRLAPLPPEASARFPMGGYFCAYEIENVATVPRGQGFVEILASAPKKTGWAPFLVIPRHPLAPANVDGCVEAWLGSEASDPGHADYWRASWEGRFFLIRGFQEDARDFPRAVDGKVFDLTLPVWRVAECLLHAAYMAEQIGDPGTVIRFRFGWEGLAARRLVSERRSVRERRAEQDRFVTTIVTTADEISSNLPELADRVCRPLLELFEFFEMPASLPSEEIARLLGTRP